MASDTHEENRSGPGLQTQTITGISVLTRVLAFTLQCVNELTIKSPCLRDMLPAAIAAGALQRMTIYGFEGDTARVRADFWIDYAGDGGLLNVSAGLCDAAGEIQDSGPVGVAPLSGADIDKNSFCPVWRQALDWVSALSQERSLRLGWTVTFSKDRRAWCERFGLSAARHIDRTRSDQAQVIPNTVLSALTMQIGFDPDFFPETDGE